MSTTDAVNKLTERYAKAYKKVHLRHLSADCRQLLHNVDSVIDMNILEDPTHKPIFFTKKHEQTAYRNIAP